MTTEKPDKVPLHVCDERMDEFQAGYRYHTIVWHCEWQFPEHTHKNFCEIVCGLKGRFQHRINGQETVQQAREIRLIRQSDVHRLYGREFSFANISFSPDRLLDLERFARLPGLADALLAAGTSPVATVPARDWQAYQRTLAQLATQVFEPGGRHVFAEFLLTTVTRYLAPHTNPDHKVDMPDWLRETLAQLEEDRDGQIPLAELVRRSGKCHEHFTREFSKRLGLTPACYLTRLRIERAARLLATSNLKISAICQSCGFDSESHFFRQFRRWKGMLPSAYRRTMGSPGILSP
jgi:AraC family cel operon transcriptional repressor